MFQSTALCSMQRRVTLGVWGNIEDLVYLKVHAMYAGPLERYRCNAHLKYVTGADPENCSGGCEVVPSTLKSIMQKKKK